MQHPTLRQLEYFLAVAERLNFREAAEACFVSQPAISGQIAQLEGQLALSLFERGPRGVRLTAAGEALVPEARRVLDATLHLVERARSLGRPLTGPLRVGSIPTVSPYLWPKVLPAVRAAHPDLALFLVEETTSRLVERLEANELDVLLLAVDVDLGDLETMPLFSDPFLLALSAQDPTAAHEEVTQADLGRDDLLLLEEGHCLRLQTLPLCQAAGGEERAGFRGTSLGTLTQMAAAGLGSTLVPELAVEREVASVPGLVVRPFGADGPHRSIGLAWRSGSPRAEEFRLLGNTIAHAYAEA